LHHAERQSSHRISKKDFIKRSREPSDCVLGAKRAKARWIWFAFWTRVGAFGRSRWFEVQLWFFCACNPHQNWVDLFSSAVHAFKLEMVLEVSHLHVFYCLVSLDEEVSTYRSLERRWSQKCWIQSSLPLEYHKLQSRSRENCIHSCCWR